MTSPTENSEFCFPSSLNEDLGETKLTVSLWGQSLSAYCIHARIVIPPSRVPDSLPTYPLGLTFVLFDLVMYIHI